METVTPERKSSRDTMRPWRRSTTTHSTPTPLTTTSSPPGTKERWTASEDGNNSTLAETPSLRTTHQLLTPSTGSPRELSPQSRTRDSADPAGPSPQLALWRELTSSPTEPFSPSLSSSSSTATRTDPWDAAVAPWKVPSSGTRTTWLTSNPTTHTRDSTEPATPPSLVLPTTRPTSTSRLTPPPP